MLRLQGEVALDGSGWESGLKKLESAGEHFAHHFKAIAASAFGFLAIEEAVRHTINFADELADTSARLGLSTDALQQFSHAARMTGADLESLTNFIEKLNIARVDPKKAGSFAKFGIDKPTEGGVDEIVRKISLAVQGKNAQDFDAELKDIGGKGAGKLIPMLKELEELAANAPVIPPQDLAAMKQLKDVFKELGTKLMSFLAPILSRIGIVILAVVDGFKALGEALSATFTQLRAALKGMSFKDFITGKGFKAFGEAFTYLGADFDRRLQENQDKTFERLNKRTEELTNPPTPDVEATEKAEKEKPEKAMRGKTGLAGDSLVRIGNFLGASQNPMERIATQHTHLLQRIASNTDHLKNETKPHQGGNGSGFGHL